MNIGRRDKQGTLIDASILQADVKKLKAKSDGKGGSSENDPDASWTKKRGQSYFGYKMHIGVDQGSGMIRKWAFTSARVHDTNLFNTLISKDEEFVYISDMTSERSSKWDNIIKRLPKLDFFNGPMITSSF